MSLGECQSKCEHLSLSPLQPATAHELHLIYLAKGLQATTAIEGNTLTEEEVQKHLAGQLEVSPSREYLVQEVKNVESACNETLEAVEAGRPLELNVRRLKALNLKVLEKLDVGTEVVPGELRLYSVTVGNVYRGAPAEDCEYLLEKLFEWLEGGTFSPPDKMKSCGVSFAILKAILAHLYLAWIHPFGDGNGRTARLIEFQILLSSGVPAPAAHLLSNHYNQTRTEYYRQLDRASKSGGEVLPFIEYAAQGFLDGLKEQLTRVWGQNYEIAWRDYVYEVFRDKDGKSEVRQRLLALELSRREGPVSKADLAGLSPQLAQLYAQKTPKTLARDLDALLKRNLVILDQGAYRARKEIMLSFRPLTKAR
ncbi:MAG: Fic family protein [FCB group bacterium]|jgi:Fic family protein|nr:Fic family protein [FCB group bacterium]